MLRIHRGNPKGKDKMDHILVVHLVLSYVIDGEIQEYHYI